MDGPVPVEFANKVRMRTLHPHEKASTSCRFVAGLILWAWLPYVLFFPNVFS